MCVIGTLNCKSKGFEFQQTGFLMHTKYVAYDAASKIIGIFCYVTLTVLWWTHKMHFFKANNTKKFANLTEL